MRRAGIEWGLKEVIIAIGVILLIGVGLMIALQILPGSKTFLESLTDFVMGALPLPKPGG